MNSYSYVANNPLKYIDPKGEKLYEFSAGFSAGPFGLNIGIRYEPGVGRQFFSSNSVGLGAGASLKYDSAGTLDQSRSPGQTYVERSYAFVPIVGVYKSTTAEEIPWKPWSLETNPKVSSGWAVGAEVDFITHSFVRDGLIRYSQNYQINPSIPPNNLPSMPTNNNQYSSQNSPNQNSSVLSRIANQIQSLFKTVFSLQSQISELKK